MKEQVFRFIGAVFLTILALLGVGAVLHILLTLPFEGKGPEWVGAIGTVATLVGTIWLATTETRRRQQQERDLAYVTIAAIEIKIVKVQKALDRAVNYFLDEMNRRQGFRYEIQATLLEDAGTWSNEEILPLIVVPDHICARLAATRPVLLECIKSLRDMEEKQRYSWVQADKAKLDGELTATLIRCRDTVNFSFDSLQAFASNVSAR